MKGEIFLIKNDGKLVEMKETSYESESLLQNLLAEYPNLLAGAQIDQNNPRKWLLVSREIGIPSEENSYDRWAVDHLFLDQEGIPTLVEVKRSSDTRIRREVVGQLLEYAANALAYWPIEQIKLKYESRCESAGLDANEELTKFLSDEMDSDEFWESVDTNLQIGKIRLIIVADQIPLELQRIVEFLDRQMHSVEVLCIEIKQFTGQSLKTLVPRVIGRTAESAQKKASPSRRRWNEEKFFEAIGNSCTAQEVELVRALLNFGKDITGRDVDWGTGVYRGSFTARLIIGEKRYSLFSVFTTSEFSINLGWNWNKPIGMEVIEQFRNIVRDRLDLAFDKSRWNNGWPIAQLSLLSDPQKLKIFKEIIETFKDSVKTNFIA